MSINNKKYVKIRTVTDGLPEEEERSIGGGAVDSVNGKTGNVVLTGRDIKATLLTSEGESITLPITDQLQNLANGQDGLTNKITQIEAIIPAGASAQNPLSTVDDYNRLGATLARVSQGHTEVETYLQNAINTNTTAIEAEVTRAQGAERTLTHKIDGNTTQISANQTAIASEVTRATSAEQALNGKITDNTNAIEVNKASIASEKTRAEGAESTIQNALTAHIDNISNPHEVTKAQVGLANVDDTSDLNKPVSTAQAEAISTAVAAETSARESAIEQVSNKINDIEELIPATASSTNKMADQAFVNSTVQTGTANFRGYWTTWDAIPTDSAAYPVDYAGSKIPTVNDYLALADASGYPGEELKGTWRFKYSGTWAQQGKNGWLPEYPLNEEPLTMAQLAALNSGVTSELLTTIQQNIATNESGISQLNADLTQGLAEKADTATVTAQLAEKADKTGLESLAATVSALSTTVAGKADSNSLGTMASKAADDYSTTLQANTLYAPKSLETSVSQLSATVATKADNSAVEIINNNIDSLYEEVGEKLDATVAASTYATNTEVANKANSDLSNIPANYDYVIETQSPTAENGNSWYRKYKSGWIEQGGLMLLDYTTADEAQQFSINLIKPMLNVEYTCLLSCQGGWSTTRIYGLENVLTTLLKGYVVQSTATRLYFRWFVCGMAA